MIARLSGVLGILVAGCAVNPVPDPADQAGLPSPQAVSAVDISADGRVITVATLAFRHQPNVWALSADGTLRFGRAVAPWAPWQVAALNSGRGFGVGLAYSRVTSPFPTISLFGGEKDEETVLEDSYGDRGWLRYGEGDWRSGWLRSLLGDLLVHAGDSIITVRGHNGALRLDADGERRNFPLKRDRPYRLTVSADGRSMASGFIVPDVAAATAEIRSLLRTPPPLVSVSDPASGDERWTYSPAGEAVPELPLPDPGRDLPGLSPEFRTAPDALVPFRVAASVAASADGSSVALAEYAGRLWVRRGPAIGKWDPPYHVIPFLPRQRGILRIIAAPGRETARVPFPEPGLFELRTDPRIGRVWAFPMSWFARGAAGSAWLPADPGGRIVYEYDVAEGSWKPAWSFPEAIGDVAFDPDGARAWVSCWNGLLYLVRREGGPPVVVDAGGPARLQWNRDGSFAVAGTSRGDVLCLDGSGVVRWKIHLPESEPAPETIKPVFAGIPVYQVGRTGKEHAYVGDTWLVKTAEGGLLIDAGGSSSIPQTLRRIGAAGVDIASVRHLLHTHSHGDHSGAAYLWRSMGLRIVAPETASYALAWLMPMLTDYGVWVPRPVDVPLPLRRAGDETVINLAGQRIRAIFVPGHSLDSTIYLLELEGKRVAFTGDLGFQAPSDILHRCWGDADKAAVVTEIVRTRVLPFRPDVVFTGHGGRAEGTAFLEDLVRRSEESIRKAREK